MILRRILLIFLGVSGFLAAETGCNRASRNEAKIVVVFVDVSGSVKDFTVYRDAWPKITGRLRGGDRIVLAAITDKTYTEFRPMLDRELPAFSYLRDNKLTYEKEIDKATEAFSQALDRVLAKTRSPKTDVMNALVLAEKIFKSDHRKPVLVILSDMLEDSEQCDFEHTELTDRFTRQVVEKRRSQNELPDLAGATIYVAGASAPTAEKAREVERFWLQYAKAANGRLLPQNYGPALVSFPE